ncbi:MAG: hypothetical protein JW939_06610, partial [Candidatus Thermoplasmatota archaeon]|nr:hypothetical protein [Candidatus Thermoplasmatota archaeon]
SALEISFGSFKVDLDPGSKQAEIPVGEGDHHAVLKAFDGEGYNASAVVHFTVDLTPPEVLILSPSNGTIISNPLVEFNWMVNDAVGIGKVSYKVDLGESGLGGPGAGHHEEMFGPGEHVFQVEATDLVGHVTSQRTSFTIGTDDLCIIEPSTDIIINSNQVHFIWRRPEWFEPAWSEMIIEGTGRKYNVTKTSEMDVAIVEEGENKVVLRFHDEFENYYEESRSVILDLDSPFVDFRNRSEFIIEDEMVVQWEGTDRSGIDHFELKMDGKILSENIKGTSTTVVGLTDGVHTLEIIAVDLAGNAGMSDWTFTVDLEPPFLMANLPKDGSVIEGMFISISWEASDENGLEGVLLSVDGKNTSFTKSGSKDLLLSSGIHIISLTAQDNAGRSTELSSRFKVDNDLPVLRWSIDTVAFLNSSSVQLEWYGSDDTGIQDRRVIVDGSLYIITDQNSTNLTLGEGYHMIMVEVYDLVGRFARIYWEPFVDLHDPELGSLKPSIDKGQVMITGNFFDNQSGIASVGLWVSNVGSASFNGNFTFSIGPSPETSVHVRVQVTDRSGRISEFDLLIPAGYRGESHKEESGSSFLIWIILIVVALLLIAVGIGAGIFLRKRSAALEYKRIQQEKDFFVQLKPAPPLQAGLPSKPADGDLGSLPPKRPISSPLRIEGEYIPPEKKK